MSRTPWSRRRRTLATSLGLFAPLLLLAGVLGTRALLVVASIGPRAEYWSQRAEQPGEVVYIALGDSLSQGIGSSSPATSFVDVLADDLEARTGGSVRVVNLSVTGAETEELLSEQVPTFLDLLDELAAQGREPALVTLAIGANDAGVSTPEEFRRDLEAVLAAMPAGTYVADVPDFNGGPRQQAAADLSEVVREQVAARDDLVLVPLERFTANQSLDDYAADFFHPSDQGYERYVAAFRHVVGQPEGAPTGADAP